LKLPGDNRGAGRLGVVSSTQDGVHAGLEKQVRRHLATRWSQPLHRPTVEVFERLQESGVLGGNRPVILDSGCGTGASTRKLANMHPQHLVIGVDRSAVRLRKSGLRSGLSVEDNCVLARGELASFWRLAFDAGLKPARHLLLYPNPWPKPRHLSRRWHAHPVFPWLLALGGEIELRCNWDIYALEYAEAVRIATGAKTEVKKIHPGQGMSPFETKYLERGHALYSVIVPRLVTAPFRLPY
jgi:tRNA G46 methylase TrmB